MRCMICRSCLTVEEHQSAGQKTEENWDNSTYNEIVLNSEQDFFEEDPAEYLEQFEAFLLEYNKDIYSKDKTLNTDFEVEVAMVLYDQDVLQHEMIGKNGFLDDDSSLFSYDFHDDDSDCSENNIKFNNHTSGSREIENEDGFEVPAKFKKCAEELAPSTSKYTEEQSRIAEQEPVAIGSIPGEEVSENDASPKIKGIRQKAHTLCREYLYGSWRRISPQELILRRISGGLSNLLFYCALPPSHSPIQGEPSRVLLRLYGQIHGEKALEGLITETVIFTLLSESQRGPKLFGIFPGGRIEEYIPARPLHTDELSEPKMSCLIAEKMALVHLMEVPINKEPHWLWDTMSRWMNSIHKFANQNHVSPENRMRVQEILNYKLDSEQQWLMKFLKSVNSPVVFCHNDLQEGNILLRNTIGQNQDPNIVIIDFEYCSYNYRGFDFANHMCEWLYDYSNENKPYFWEREEKFPTIEQQKLFITSYLRTRKRELHQQERITTEEVDNILKEIQVFTLASHFFWGLWSVVNANISTIPFDYWRYGESRFRAYFKHKAHISQLYKVDV